MMIPITRKEKYINEIVGGGDTAPETPQTREEFFFADILGEVSAPSPITRIEKYLAKIAGKYDGELPEPVTRIEFFIARAAGMNVSIPTPITREEMFWADYSLIIEKEISGIPPLTFNAIAGTLKNYRIYGQTSRNLVPDISAENGWQVGYLNGDTGEYNPSHVWGEILSPFISLDKIASFTISATNYNNPSMSVYYFNQNSYIFNKNEYDYDGSVFNNIPINATQFRFAIRTGYQSIEEVQDAGFHIMVNTGSTPLPYGPYGESVGDLVTSGEHAGEYNVPVTVEGKNLLQNTATSQTVNGVTFTVNEDGSVTCNGTTTALIVFKVNAILTLPVGEFILTGSPTGGSWYSSYYLYVQTDNISPQKFYNDTGNGVTINNTSADIVYSVRIVIERGYSINNQTFYPMIRLASIKDDTYEPYHAPVTTPIYLPEQIKKVGDEAEYIDYAEQKLHRVGAEDIDVTLPALPTLTGTNVLSVGTEVQPSNVYIKYEGAR